MWGITFNNNSLYNCIDFHFQQIRFDNLPQPHSEPLYSLHEVRKKT